MTVQISSELHLSRLHGLAGYGWHEARYSSDDCEQTERSVLVVLPRGVAISEADSLSQSLAQLEFRVAFVGSESSSSPWRAIGAKPSSRRPLASLDDIDGCDAVISFGDESLHVLKRFIPHLRASVHVGAAALALGEITASMDKATELGFTCSTGRKGAQRHRALLLDTGHIGNHDIPAGATRPLEELAVLQVDGLQHNHPYSDPLIIELARRHLSMWS